MITRNLGQRLLETSRKYPVVGIVGPRQSGKTVLATELFPNYEYVTLENPDNRERATRDPRGFLDAHKPPVILDEVQNVPELFSYLQERVDLSRKNEQYVLTGSQNFVLNQKISQTLAGRIYLAQLPTLTLTELAGVNITFNDWEDYAFKGSYPRVWDKNLTPTEWYPSYIQTYLERDVRDLKNIADLKDFQTFMGLCAGRGGQELVLNSITSDTGITSNTVKAWISVLEASYIVFLLRPYYKNFNKRMVKTPKLYFFDTGLMVNLLGIVSPDQLAVHPLRGNIFENLVISELVKAKLNLGQTNLGYYMRDKSGNEIDYVQERALSLSFTEIKASKTFSNDFLKGINYWNQVDTSVKHDTSVVYTGDWDTTIAGTRLVNWKNMETLINPLY